MAYISKDEKKKIVEALKPILKEYSMSATFAIHNYSAFVVNLNKGSIDFGLNENGYKSVNTYHIDTDYSGIQKEFLKKLMNTIKTVSDWYDNTDIMSDYFDTKFYIDINIGRWDKPYQLLEK